MGQSFSLIGAALVFAALILGFVVGMFLGGVDNKYVWGTSIFVLLGLAIGSGFVLGREEKKTTG